MLRALRLFFKSIVLLWAFSRLIVGYIDPNTGGMLFQLLAVFLAASSAIILFFSRSIRIQIARFWRAMRSRSDKS
jgi:hypothetical protein